MMNHADPELRDQLAAEYALGTLSSPERRRFERLMSHDRDLRDLVQGWELRLNALAESVPPVEPPAHVWDEIARRIAMEPSPAPEPAGKRWWLDRLWDNLVLWRGAAALATATAAALVLYVALLPPSVQLERIAGEIAALGERLANVARQVDAVASRPTHVAVLLDKDQRPMMTADLDAADGRLVLRLNLTPPRDFTSDVLQVWLVSPDGTSRSLGIFPSERPGTTTALVLPHDTAEAITGGVAGGTARGRYGLTTQSISGGFAGICRGVI